MADGNPTERSSKVKLSFYAKPDLARAVRTAAYKHRLTLEEFFESAAMQELSRLEREPPDEPQTVTSLRKGRPLRPKEP